MPDVCPQSVAPAETPYRRCEMDPKSFLALLDDVRLIQAMHETACSALRLTVDGLDDLPRAKLPRMAPHLDALSNSLSRLGTAAQSLAARIQAAGRANFEEKATSEPRDQTI
jgi:hypothetical protein